MDDLKRKRTILPSLKTESHAKVELEGMVMFIFRAMWICHLPQHCLDTSKSETRISK